MIDFGRRDEMALLLSNHIAVVIETQSGMGERDFGKLRNRQRSLGNNQVLDVLRQVFGVCVANLYTITTILLFNSSYSLLKSRKQNGSRFA